VQVPQIKVSLVEGALRLAAVLAVVAVLARSDKSGRATAPTHRVAAERPPALRAVRCFMAVAVAAARRAGRRLVRVVLAAAATLVSLLTLSNQPPAAARTWAVVEAAAK
jgi:hypothetical protein